MRRRSKKVQKGGLKDREVGWVAKLSDPLNAWLNKSCLDLYSFLALPQKQHKR